MFAGDKGRMSSGLSSWMSKSCPTSSGRGRRGRRGTTTSICSCLCHLVDHETEELFDRTILLRQKNKDCSRNFGANESKEVETSPAEGSEERGFGYASFVGDGHSASIDRVCALKVGVGPHLSTPGVEEERVYRFQRGWSLTSSDE